MLSRGVVGEVKATKDVQDGNEDTSMKEVEGDLSLNGNGKMLHGGAENGGALHVLESEKEEENGEGEEEEEEEEDDDDDGEEEDEEDDEEEEEDDDEDEDEEGEEEEEGSGSDSGTFQSLSELEVAQGSGETSARKSPAKDGDGNRTVQASSDGVTAKASSPTGNGIDRDKAGSSDLTEKEVPKGRRAPKRRSPSIDLSLPVGPPARPTMRLKLTVAHNEEEDYLTNVPEEVYKILKEKHDPWADWYKSSLPESEDTDMTAGSNEGPDLHELGGLAKLLQKYPDKVNGGSGGKKKKFDEYDIGQYDVRDPFVDDSELGVDEPTHSAKPTADGFFVTQGEVELQKAIAAAKDSKSNLIFTQGGIGKKAPIPTGFGQKVEGGGGGAGAVSVEMGPKENPDYVGITNALLAEHAVDFGMISPPAIGDESRISYFNLETKAAVPSSPSTSNAIRGNETLEGSRMSPIKVDDDDGEAEKSPSKNLSVAKYPTRPVPKRLEVEFDMLRQKVAKESWLKKTKFPPDLRDPLLQASRIAVALNEYNDNFFNWLPQIFPYNRLTLHKYTKRQFVTNHVAFIAQLLDFNLKSFELQIKEALPLLVEEHEDVLQKWRSDGEQSLHGNGANHNQEESHQEVGEDLAAADLDGEGEHEEAADKADEEAAKSGEPTRRWRWSEQMREVLFTIVTIDSAMVQLKIEKAGLDGSEQKSSIINARKLLYKRIHDLWPDRSWTTTTSISREYGLYKKKVEKYTQQHFQTQGRDMNYAITL
ncbi:hypothetical protein CBS101457_004007 [Exobasidium rhododendri]|nr:hypothetical protein CBS101457_004007 [Exobasidium rhododendri]